MRNKLHLVRALYFQAHLHVCKDPKGDFLGRLDDTFPQPDRIASQFIELLYSFEFLALLLIMCIL
jgi:hypothetical protein